jgi:hypothetical protein
VHKVALKDKMAEQLAQVCMVQVHLDQKVLHLAVDIRLQLILEQLITK